MIRTKNSASNLSRRKLCPGSANAEQGLTSEDSEWSKEGTLLHHHDTHPDEPQIELTERQRYLLQVNADLRIGFLRENIEPLGVKIEDAKIFKEREMFLSDANGIPIEVPEEFVGHSDWMYWFPKIKTMVIFDSKFGHLLVEHAKDNLQLRAYAVMASDDYDMDQCLVAITQPRAPREEQIHGAKYLGTDLPLFKQELMQIIENTKAVDAPRFATIDACRYCLAAAQCPATTEAIKKIVAIDPNSISEMEAETLENLWGVCQIADKAIEKIKARLKYIAQTKPTALVKYQLGKAAIMRTITDSEKAFEILFQLGLLGILREEARAAFDKCCDPDREMLKGLVARLNNKTLKEAETLMLKALRDNGVLDEKEKSPSLVEK